MHHNYSLPSDFHPIYFAMEPGIHRLLNGFPRLPCNKYNFSARWLLPQAGSEMSVLIKHFTFNYISQFTHGDTGFHHMGLQAAILLLFAQAGEVLLEGNDSHMKNPSFL